jgi:[lysine-biosynthesis-protein LysW]--L-2-aminoadipate ligase
LKSEVSVLCTRVRMEEKRLIAALATAGVVAQPLPPSDTPLPIEPLAIDVASGAPSDYARVLIDRHADRTSAAYLAPYWRATSRAVVDGGQAASLDRLALARLLAESGLPRPQSALVLSESSGLQAMATFENCATLLPLAPGSPELPLPDREIAEAVLEHREILGHATDAVSVVQEGIAREGNRIVVTVVDGTAIATAGVCAECERAQSLDLAARTATFLGARLLGVTIAAINGRLVVWDVNPVPEYRNATPIGDVSVEDAIVALVHRIDSLATMTMPTLAHLHNPGATGNVSLSA